MLHLYWRVGCHPVRSFENKIELRYAALLILTGIGQPVIVVLMKEHMRRTITISRNTIRNITLFTCLALFLTGCTMWPEDDKPFAVSDSSLNWTEIYYTTTNTATAVRLSILGSGNVVLCRGTSSRLLDAFAIDVESANWDDFERDEINLARKEVQQIHQLLINRGVLIKNKTLPPETTTVVQLHGRIDDRVFSCVSADPPLLQVVETIVKLFPPPTTVEAPKP